MKIKSWGLIAALSIPLISARSFHGDEHMHVKSLLTGDLEYIGIDQCTGIEESYRTLISSQNDNLLVDSNNNHVTLSENPPDIARINMKAMAWRFINLAKLTRQKAIEIDPVPEYQWTSIEVLEQSKQYSDANSVRESILLTGEKYAPRFFALYLVSNLGDFSRTENPINKKLRNRQYSLILIWLLAPLGSPVVD